jgi:hypothetical protein
MKSPEAMKSKPTYCVTHLLLTFASFLAELRQISVNFHELSNTTLEGMRRTPCLVASQRKLRKSQRSEGDINEFEDSDWEVTNYFKKPNEIIIADDTQSLRVFGESLFMAPQEDILEGVLVMV